MSWFKREEPKFFTDEDKKLQNATEELSKFVPDIYLGMPANLFWLELTKSATGLFTELHRLKEEYEALIREAKK